MITTSSVSKQVIKKSDFFSILVEISHEKKLTSGPSVQIYKVNYIPDEVSKIWIWNYNVYHDQTALLEQCDLSVHCLLSPLFPDFG